LLASEGKQINDKATSVIRDMRNSRRLGTLQWPTITARSIASSPHYSQWPSLLLSSSKDGGKIGRLDAGDYRGCRCWRASQHICCRTRNFVDRNGEDR
jgi:hypothetical protein